MNNRETTSNTAAASKLPGICGVYSTFISWIFIFLAFGRLNINKALKNPTLKCLHMCTFSLQLVNSQWVAVPEPSSPGRPAPRTLLRQTKQPGRQTCVDEIKEASDLLVCQDVLLLTLLCTSHGLVMADKSQAVIIIALKLQRFRDQSEEQEQRTARPRWSYSHDDFFSGGFQRHEVHPLLFLLVGV